MDEGLPACLSGLCKLYLKGRRRAGGIGYFIFIYGSHCDVFCIDHIYIENID